MRSSLIGLTLATIPAASLAHTGAAGHGFASGFAHPLAGLDHLLAMAAVGLWATQIGGRSLWAIPAAFLAVMGLGAMLAAYGAHLPLLEIGIAGSVVVFGLLVALAARLPLAVGAGLTGLLAIFHGFAHGAEMVPNASLLTYGSGFLAATAMLHGLGMALGSLRFTGIGGILMRIAGGATASAGVFLLPGVT